MTGARDDRRGEHDEARRQLLQDDFGCTQPRDDQKVERPAIFLAGDGHRRTDQDRTHERHGVKTDDQDERPLSRLHQLDVREFPPSRVAQAPKVPTTIASMNPAK